MKQRSDIVSATEIADWAWCPEAWRLKSLGHDSSNQAALKRGEKHHGRKAWYEVLSRSAISFGWWLVALAVVLVVLALVMGR